jgi:hypothetical protein
MNLRRFATDRAALTHLQRFQSLTGHQGHSHFFERVSNRRAFLTASAGAVLAPSLFGKRPSSSIDPRPIPGGNQFLFPPDPTVFHINPPVPGVDVSPITDFNGFIGATELQGTWVKTSGPGPGPVGTLNWDADLRFLVGTFIGVDGKPHQGTFGFFWVDLYEDQAGPFTNQTHDFNPGITQSGLFWIAPIPSGSVRVNPDAGNASMEVTGFALEDYHDFVNALLDGPELDATLSLKVDWSPPKAKGTLRDPANRFVLDFVQTAATTSWEASSGGNTFRSATVNPPLFAIVGHERNGVFFS